MTEPGKPDSAKALLAAAGIIAMVAIFVLVIDWNIKNSILRESKALRLAIERQRTSYYGQAVADIPGGIADAGAATGDGLGGDPRVEKEAVVSSLKRHVSAGKTDRPRSHSGSGNGSVEVSEGNGPVGS